MGFWIYMLIMDLLVPVTMIDFGKYFKTKAPKEINAVFGYRTSMSMKNRDTWEFAHKYCGKIWYICGWILLIVTIVAMIPFFGQGADVVGIVGAVLLGIQMIPLVGSILPTELALRKHFDKSGNRRMPDHMKRGDETER
ncbi:SdpI family protein [[Ruminococcus] lactaris]|uniref:SdpI family protein n=1 Tax=[Ruminococcus] lactaris TaxID=46228 RepID=UPI0030791533